MSASADPDSVMMGRAVVEAHPSARVRPFVGSLTSSGLAADLCGETGAASWRTGAVAKSLGQARADAEPRAAEPPDASTSAVPHPHARFPKILGQSFCWTWRGCCHARCRRTTRSARADAAARASSKHPALNPGAPTPRAGARSKGSRRCEWSPGAPRGGPGESWAVRFRSYRGCRHYEWTSLERGLLARRSCSQRNIHGAHWAEWSRVEEVAGKGGRWRLVLLRTHHRGPGRARGWTAARGRRGKASPRPKGPLPAMLHDSSRPRQHISATG